MTSSDLPKRHGLGMKIAIAVLALYAIAMTVLYVVTHSAVAGGARQLADGTSQAKAGAAAVASGASDLDKGLGKLSDATGKVDAGAFSAQQGALQLQSGSAQLNAGGQELLNGANTLTGGAFELANGSYKLVDGSGQLAAGAGNVSAGANTLAGGVSDMVGGLRQKAAPGAMKLYYGASLLNKRVNEELLVGAKNLNVGAQKLSQAAAGTDQIAQQLMDGAQKIQEKLGDPNVENTKANNIKKLDSVAGITLNALLTNQMLVFELQKHKGLANGGISNDICVEKDKEIDQKDPVGGGLVTIDGSVVCTLIIMSGGLQEINKSVNLGDTTDPSLVAAIAKLAGGTQLLAQGGPVPGAAPGTPDYPGTANLSMLTGGTLPAPKQSLLQGTQALEAGINKLIKEGTVPLTAGAKELSDGLADAVSPAKGGALESGAHALAEGAGRLSGGANDLHAGTQTLAAGASKLSGGAVSLTTGVSTLASGLTTLDDGAISLGEGLTQLSDGTSKLDDGAKDAKDGSSKLADGTKKLADGAGELDAGAAKLSTASGGILPGTLPWIIGAGLIFLVGVGVWYAVRGRRNV